MRFFAISLCIASVDAQLIRDGRISSDVKVDGQVSSFLETSRFVEQVPAAETCEWGADLKGFTEGKDCTNPKDVIKTLHKWTGAYKGIDDCKEQCDADPECDAVFAGMNWGMRFSYGGRNGKANRGNYYDGFNNLQNLRVCRLCKEDAEYTSHKGQHSTGWRDVSLRKILNRSKEHKVWTRQAQRSPLKICAEGTEHQTFDECQQVCEASDDCTGVFFGKQLNIATNTPFSECKVCTSPIDQEPTVPEPEAFYMTVAIHDVPCVGQ